MSSSHPTIVDAQTASEETDAAVEAIFNTLTPAERVGQLFMISFRGDDVGEETEIAGLIRQYRVGGVVLSAANENFTNSSLTPARVLALTNVLQLLAQEPPPPPENEGETSGLIQAQPEIAAPPDVYTPLPLFVAVAHEGDGFPYTDPRGGLIDIPNQMALGATWNTEFAHQVGEVVGQELSLLGINMLFGPSLDVLDNPRERGRSLETRTFGGHPFWVGEMGQAYIEGVHQGSNDQLLTIAKHFPGFGSSDREINRGVPTILKSLDALRRTELVPFFHVTHLNPDDPGDATGLTDGLMTAHVRYQGLQGNVPMSLDARNLPALLALKEIAPWREAGGLIVSAPLGAPAALEGITVSQDAFPARRLTQDAFLAGSDILLLSNFGFKDKPEDELANIENAIKFFQEKYASDPNFQAAVDRSVKRILKAKLKIYGQDLLQIEAQQPADNLTLLRDITIDLDQIAQAGVTLITPITQQGLTPLPGPPESNDNILIFTDDRVVRDCPDCPGFSVIGTNALQQIILQLFGPDATGQISAEQINSLSFADIKTLVASEEEAQETEENIETSITEIESLIETADWIIFAMLDIDPEANPQSDAVRVLLRSRYDTLRSKNLVLFAFNAPYFLDETEISQLTAYYGFYSKGPAYLRTAARLLFQQFEPSGASPVAIPATGPLDLNPDPTQTIQLEPVHMIDSNSNVVPLPQQSGPVTTLDLEVGEGILFRTSEIVDRNNNPVPDGTLVDFFRFYPLEGLSLEPLSASTTDGIAEITIIKERETPLQVRASSNLAVQSVPFDIGPGIIDTPTPTPTATPTPTDIPTASPTATQTATPTMEPEPTEEIPIPLPTEPPVGGNTKLLSSKPADFLDFLYSLGGMLLIGGIAFSLGGDRFSLEERVRPTLMAIAAGLIGYILYVLAAVIFSRSGYLGNIIQYGLTGHWVAPLISILCAILGMTAWYLKHGWILWGKDGLIPADSEAEAE